MAKSSNPLGKGTRNISANVPNELYLGIESLAKISGVSFGAYVRTVMADAVAKKVVIRENEQQKRAWLDAIKNGTQVPKVQHEVTPAEESPIVDITIPIATQGSFRKETQLRAAESKKKTG